MTYYTGTIAAVPTDNRQKFIEHTQAAWKLFQTYGAQRMVENWGVDVQKGKVNDLYGAVNAKDGESIIFSWIEWPSKSAADAAWKKMETDPAMQQMPEMPFDGSRMIFGGFEPVLAEGTDKGVGYVQGFALAVPEKNKAAYTDMAKNAWETMFRPHGCTGIVEAWGTDVPHGKQTDFYRASLAEDGEVPVFSWCAWPDKATCEAAAKAMEADMQGQEFPEMPFDGMRMMWGGFEPVFDSAKAV
ncbi:DUF1428 domain-containing protein [Aureimonas fodinaquatilis]|uniref:DUF1428 domain-containing protein n=1 Tax=Aureimonas fodinaquatilis TaxID=2565783 RepID=A0A5B0DUZ5_9HYPH|nr:DUF1428 domain-containing protein [Aureimonas fodinaquatilis]KAA0970266.1 DUF1428 domain-containing protein [Aureimonas fodinaquatilis]